MSSIPAPFSYSSLPTQFRHEHEILQQAGATIATTTDTKASPAFSEEQPTVAARQARERVSKPLHREFRELFMGQGLSSEEKDELSSKILAIVFEREE